MIKVNKIIMIAIILIAQTADASGGAPVTSEEAFTKLTKRVKTLESHVSGLRFLTDDVDELKRNGEEKGSSVQKMQDMLLLNIDKVKNFDMQFDKINDQIEDLNVKVLDFNIYDQFKGNTGEGGESVDPDRSIMLIQNLEKKVFKKFEFIDIANKKTEEEFYKLKAELNIVKNHDDMTQKALLHSKEDLEKMAKKVEIVSTNYEIEDELLKSDMVEKLELTKNFFLDKINELMQSLDIKEKQLRLSTEEIDSSNPKKQNSSTLDEKDLKLFKDTAKKVMEIDRTFKIFSGTINVDAINKAINKINEQMATKVSIYDFNNLSDIVNQLQYQVNFMKDNVTQLMEDNKVLDDITWLRKKVESIASSLSNIKPTEESVHIKTGGRITAKDYLTISR